MLRVREKRLWKIVASIFLTVVLIKGCTYDVDYPENGLSDQAEEVLILDEEVLGLDDEVSDDALTDDNEEGLAPRLWEYEFIWPEGRHQEWEEDIIYFAQMFLFDHPLLRNVQVPMNDVQSILSGAKLSDYTVNFHDANLRDQFLHKIHELIDLIPELEEHEIIFSLSEIAALLGDAHTGLVLNRFAFQRLGHHYYPFDFIYFSDGFFVQSVSAPSDSIEYYEEVLYSRLLAINGVDVEQIMEMLSVVIPHENNYQLLVRGDLADLMQHGELLTYLGITTGGETEFLFENLEGDVFRVNASARAVCRDVYVETTFIDINIEGFLKYSRPDWQWFEFLEDYNAMYLRLHNLFGTPATPSLEEFYLSLTQETSELLEAREIEKFVIDLRGNRGGFLEYFEILFELIYSERNDLGSVYVLINHYTYSSGVVAAAIMKNYIEDVLLVGEPTSQPPNFFAGTSPYWLPHSNIAFEVSRVYFGILPEYLKDTLTPDIFIPMTFEDFINHRDPVLEAIFADVN